MTKATTSPQQRANEADLLGFAAPPRLDAEKRIVVLWCKRCTSSIRPGHEYVPKRLCFDCGVLDDAVRRQKERVARWRLAAEAERRAEAKALEAKVDPTSIRYHVCEKCKEIFRATYEVIDGKPRLAAAGLPTERFCHACFSVASLLLQFSARKRREAELAERLEAALAIYDCTVDPNYEQWLADQEIPF